MASGYTLKWYGKTTFATAQKVNVDTMDIVVKMVEKYVKEHFTKQGTYEAYRRGENRTHWSAAPNEPPAIDLGVLRASIQSEVVKTAVTVVGKVGTDENIIRTKAKAGVDVKYGLYLELGTNKMKPRPFLRPAVRENAKKILDIFKKANGK